MNSRLQVQVDWHLASGCKLGLFSIVHFVRVVVDHEPITAVSSCIIHSAGDARATDALSAHSEGKYAVQELPR